MKWEGTSKVRRRNSSSVREKLQQRRHTTDGQADSRMRSVWNLPSASGTKIEITYPLHIRFLDMKKNRKGKKKKRYAPIYNKYVCGYLKADVHRTLNRLVPKIMINAIEDTF